jgi:hypothetical protein
VSRKDNQVIAADNVKERDMSTAEQTVTSTLALGAHPEQGFYAIGAKSYGRAPNLLLATGYEQARSVVAELAGDHDAAARVELVLPASGSTCGVKAQPEPEAPETEPATSACCG